MSPIPGDPGSIRTWATTYGGIADTIVEASSQLQSLELGEQTSIAVIEYHDNAQYLGENIALTEPRYRAVHEALTFYADELEAAQQTERDAIAAAEAAETEHASANSDYLTKWEAADTAAHDPAATDAAETRAASDTAWYRLEEARIAQGQAQVDLENAQIRAENAGRTAASMITTAVDGDGMNDTWWDDWGKGLYDVLSVVGMVIVGVVAVVAIVGLVLATIGTAGIALPAAVVAAVGVVAAAGVGIAALMGLMTGGAMLSGEKGLENQLMWDAIGLLPFSKFLKGPIAKVLRNMDLPATGPGSLAGAPRISGTTPTTNRFIDAAGRGGETQKAAVEFYLDNQVDIFASVGLEAGQNITAGTPSLLPDLTPNDQAPNAHQEGWHPGDSQYVPPDEYRLDPLVPDFGTPSTVFGGNDTGVQPPPTVSPYPLTLPGSSPVVPGGQTYGPANPTVPDIGTGTGTGTGTDGQG
ncbi:hypothetical protein PUY80_15330 [Plantibacter flavus]|uniref:hypothetical protein n=1 Tax=Plantibacter flavus TaxID=150123 RepID=UPI002379B748|nr:hypothetical protein [Plantibacter flavus]MDD9153942.1 hypothetical protein [Plantibacter flavus]